MLKKFLSNCKKPTGKFGKMIVSAMNKGHAPLALWAFEECPLKDGESVRDPLPDQNLSLPDFPFCSPQSQEFLSSC